MGVLKFKTQRGIQIDTSKTKPVNEFLKLANQVKLSTELGEYIDKINLCNGYILVTVGQDGETFDNSLMNCKEDVFNSVMDKLFPR